MAVWRSGVLFLLGVVVEASSCFLVMLCGVVCLLQLIGVGCRESVHVDVWVGVCAYVLLAWCRLLLL